MNNIPFRILIWLLFTLIATPLTQSFAGTDDDAAEHGADDGGSCLNALSNFVPIFMPDIDQHKGRGVVQLPPLYLPAIPIPIIAALPMQQAQFPLPIAKKCANPTTVPIVAAEGDQDQGRGAVQEPSDQKPPRTFPHRLKDPRVDEKYGRKVITLDGGSPDNPYQVVDHGLFYIGALIGVSFVEPHTMIQFNALSKWKYTRGNSAHRRAKNYDEGISKPWAKYPKKVEDFAKWEVGDWIRRNGSFSVAFYAGVSYFLPDARVGVVSEVVKSVHYQKLDPDHVRVSITREIGGGMIARAQMMPFQKAEAKNIGNHEQARVYLFDLTNENERKALDDLVQRNILFAGSEAYHAAKDNEATLLTTRVIKRNKSTFTPFQVGVPILARARMTWHTDRYRTQITTHRGDIKYYFTAKAHYKQTTYRHKNFKPHRGSHKGKKWRHYMDKHQHYNRAYQGGVVRPPRIKNIEELQLQFKKDGGLQFTQAKQRKQDEQISKIDQRYIQLQLSFTNDRVDAKKVNSYLKRFARKIGVNDHMVDVGYKSDAMIGYAELRWDFRVGPNAVNHVVKAAMQDEHLFKGTANDLIDAYFSKKEGEYKNDPHHFCSSRIKNTQFCIWKLRRKTQKALQSITKNLRSLEEKGVAKSARKSASRLSKIAKKLSTNQFVLQSFILALPPNIDGYGRLQIFGERFLGREFNTDPGKNMKEVNSFTSPWSDVAPETDQEDQNPDLHDFDNVSSEDLTDESRLDDDVLEFDWNRINRRDDVNEF